MTITPQMTVFRRLCFRTLSPASLIKISSNPRCSLAVAVKEKRFLKKGKERRQRELMEQEIGKAQEEAEALNLLRKAREGRVPPQPTENGVFVSVCHVRDHSETRPN